MCGWPGPPFQYSNSPATKRVVGCPLRQFDPQLKHHFTLSASCHLMACDILPHLYENQSIIVNTMFRFVSFRFVPCVWLVLHFWPVESTNHIRLISRLHRPHNDYSIAAPLLDNRSTGEEDMNAEMASRYQLNPVIAASQAFWGDDVWLL